MKKILFGILIVITWYLAAMYRLDSLMASAVMEFAVFLAMLVCVRYFKRKIKITFRQRHMIVNREEYTECPVIIDNRGRLPISRIRIRFSYVYEGETDRKRAVFFGNIDKRRRDEVSFKLSVPWNGRLLVRIEKIEVYDYLSLFKARIRCDENMMVTLLPPGGRPEIPAEIPEEAAVFMANGSELSQRGTAFEEFVQVREYTPQDEYRSIHWKQSARTGILLVKEYQEARTKGIEIRLDFYQYDKKCIEEISAFYEELWSQILSLFEQGYLVRLSWKTRDGGKVNQSAANENTLASIFVELYEKNWLTREEGESYEILENKYHKNMGK